MNRPRAKRAFTLIELMAASVLTALLMIVVFHIVGSMARRQAVLERQERTSGGGWPDGVVELIRSDLQQTRAFASSENQWTLTGSCSIDPVALESDPQPVTVTYAVESLGGRSWLVRQQARRGSRATENRWPELVCADVASFELEPLDEPEIARLMARADAGRGGGKPLTNRVRLTIPIDAAGRELLDRVIVLR